MHEKWQTRSVTTMSKPLTKRLGSLWWFWQMFKAMLMSNLDGWC